MSMNEYNDMREKLEKLYREYQEIPKQEFATPAERKERADKIMADWTELREKRDALGKEIESARGMQDYMDALDETDARMKREERAAALAGSATTRAGNQPDEMQLRELPGELPDAKYTINKSIDLRHATNDTLKEWAMRNTIGNGKYTIPAATGLGIDMNFPGLRMPSHPEVRMVVEEAIIKAYAQARAQSALAAMGLHTRDLGVTDFGTLAAPREHIGADFLPGLLLARKRYEALMNYATLRYDDRGAIKYDWDLDDTQNEATIVAEATAMSAPSNPKFSSTEYKIYKYSTGVLPVSLESLADAYYNLAEEVGNWFGVRMGRGVNRHRITGNGTTEPMGLFTAAVDSGIAIAAGDDITKDHIIQVRTKLDPSYRTNARWMCSKEVESRILQIETTTGLPLWQQGNIAEGRPDKLNGFDFVINDFSADHGTSGNKFLVFGDLSYYNVWEVPVFYLAILREHYAENGQVGFLGIARTGANLRNPADQDAVDRSPVLALVTD